MRDACPDDELQFKFFLALLIDHCKHRDVIAQKCNSFLLSSSTVVDLIRTSLLTSEHISCYLISATVLVNVL